MSCRACETITPDAGAVAADRAWPAGSGLLAHVLVAKYCDHAPLYRQSAIYARAGVELERSTLADWVGQAAFLLEPLAAAIARHVRAGAALHADDTPVPVLDPGRGKTKTGRLWVLVRDERPWGRARAAGGQLPLLARPQGRACARRCSRACRGFLHADGYAGFNGLYEPDASGAAPLVEVACWSHSRGEALRRARRHRLGDRQGGARADRRPVRDRGRDQRSWPEAAPRRPPGTRAPAARRT